MSFPLLGWPVSQISIAHICTNVGPSTGMWLPTIDHIPREKWPFLPQQPSTTSSSPLSIHAGSLIDLNLYRSCAGNHCCYELMCAAHVMSYPEVCISQLSSHWPALTFFPSTLLRFFSLALDMGRFMQMIHPQRSSTGLSWAEQSRLHKLLPTSRRRSFSGPSSEPQNLWIWT